MAAVHQQLGNPEARPLVPKLLRSPSGAHYREQRFCVRQRREGAGWWLKVAVSKPCAKGLAPGLGIKLIPMVGLRPTSITCVSGGRGRFAAPATALPKGRVGLASALSGGPARCARSPATERRRQPSPSVSLGARYTRLTDSALPPGGRLASSPGHQAAKPTTHPHHPPPPEYWSSLHSLPGRSRARSSASQGGRYLSDALEAPKTTKGWVFL